MHPFDGIIDIHAHADPDKTGRSLDVLELAKLYRDRGFRAVVLMNHYDSTAGMAYLANKYTPGIEVYGGMVLNRLVGGLNPAAVEHMLRIGRHAIVSFPNFGHWGIRLQLLFGGHMPRTDNLPYAWWDSPNIHFCTIKDFRHLSHEVGAKMEKAVALNAWGRALRFNAPWWFWNLLGEQAVFLLSRRK